MKGSHIGLSVAIVLLSIISIGVTLTSKEEDPEALFAEKAAAAADYAEQGLYEKSVLTYQEALKIKADRGAEMRLLQSAKARSLEDPDYRSKYLTIAKNMAQNDPLFTDAAVHAGYIYWQREDYAGAYKFLKNIRRRNKNEVIEDMLFRSQHAYKMNWLTYDDIRFSLGDNYAAKKENAWIQVDMSGGEDSYKKAEQAQAPGEDGFRWLMLDGKSVMLDGDDVLEAYLDFVPEDAGYYHEGFIPLKHEGTYAFYDAQGHKVLGDYEMAGSFTEGKAPVKENGVWKIIDTTGADVSDASYEEILWGPDGQFIKDDVFLARQDGSIKIFSAEDGSAVEGFEAEEADGLIKGQPFAFKKDGLWGFAKTDGSVIIEPKYQEARSFSQGRAAVSNGERWGFVDEQDRTIYDYQFIDVSYFNNQNNCMVEVEPGVWQLLMTYVH